MKPDDENSSQGRRKRNLVPVISAASAALGLAVAAAVFSVTAGNSSVTAGISVPASASASASAPSVSHSASPSAAPGSTTPGTSDSSPSTGSSGGSKKSASGGSSSTGSTSGGSSSGGSASNGSTSGGGSSAAPAPAPPAPAPAPTSCPGSRGENPALWDACRAGYVAPTISFGGLVSCTAVDRAAGTWAVTYRLTASGGNYRGSWSGMTNNGNGTDTVNIYGLPAGALGSPVPMSASGGMMMSAMNGLQGWIDEVDYSDVVMVTLSSVCS